MAKLPTMTDEDMVLQQRAAMTNPNAPAASIEAILHAILPFKFVDHSHANAISALTCAKDGEARTNELFGSKVLVLPYVMPGFVLAKQVFDVLQKTDLRKEGIEGIVLLKHGLFTFADDAKASYEKHIELVTKAEEYLSNRAIPGPSMPTGAGMPLLQLAQLRQLVSKTRGFPQIARLSTSEAALSYGALPNIADCATRGPLTPDHSIRTKRIPVVLDDDHAASVQKLVSIKVFGPLTVVTGKEL